MFNSVQDWLPTLIGAAIFVVFSACVLATLSAIASKIEDRFAKSEMSAETAAEPGSDSIAQAA